MTAGRPKGKMSHLEKYVQYIRNATGAKLDDGLLIEHFDEDHAPIGNVVRFDMRRDGLIFEMNDRIFLTDKAKQNR